VCSNNLKQIGIALHNYHQVHNCFPAPYAKGKPMHSWRMAILPYAMSQNVYQQYDYNQPWDSPANLALARSFQPFYCVCPSAKQPSRSGLTDYVMVVGPKAATHGGEWTSLDEITDGTANTIVVVEIADSDIFWTEPRDLSLDEMTLQINDKSKPNISSHHPHGAMVLFADGSIRFLDESMSTEELRAMLTASAGDGGAVRDSTARNRGQSCLTCPPSRHKLSLGTVYRCHDLF
jgi:prepilin-type processing-associated H-X9-DG protein